MQRSSEPDHDGGAAVWAFLWVLFAFKMATVALIFWQLRTWESNLVLGATTWYWFPVAGALAAAPVAYHLRVRRVRRRRAALLRAEWMVGSEGVSSRPEARR